MHSFPSSGFIEHLPSGSVSLDQGDLVSSGYVPSHKRDTRIMKQLFFSRLSCQNEPRARTECLTNNLMFVVWGMSRTDYKLKVSRAKRRKPKVWSMVETRFDGNFFYLFQRTSSPFPFPDGDPLLETEDGWSRGKCIPINGHWVCSFSLSTINAKLH